MLIRILDIQRSHILKCTLHRARPFGQYICPQNQSSILKTHQCSKRRVMASSRECSTVSLKSEGKNTNLIAMALSLQSYLRAENTKKKKKVLELLTSFVSNRNYCSFWQSPFREVVCENLSKEGKPTTSSSLRFTLLSPDVSLPVRQRKEASTDILCAQVL